MNDTNDLMAFISASPGTTLDEICRLNDCIFELEDPELVMFLNAMGRKDRGDCFTEVVLMLAFVESGTAKRGRNRLSTRENVWSRLSS